jgi:hypothetical protein
VTERERALVHSKVKVHSSKPNTFLAARLIAVKQSLLNWQRKYLTSNLFITWRHVAIWAVVWV